MTQWERPPRLFARRALTGQGWQRDVRLEIDAEGMVADVTPDTAPQKDTPIFDLLLPGMANVHSHAFQRAMAGLTERASGHGRDHFWSWREAMYAFTARLTPEMMEAVARAFYIELLKSGYTAVGEFHYLHHDPQGRPYAAPTEMSDRIAAAAQASGIHLTHLPVFYETANFGGMPANEGQRRFVHTPEAYLRLLETLHTRYGNTPGITLGIAPHSLRAATPDALRTLLNALPGLGLAECPIHIHVAEQEKEVADCLAWSGKRPVAWLLEYCPVDQRWCLVHATHITPEELRGIIRSGATVGLCPTTEANLGDGVFPAEAYAKAKGKWGVGSDSHVCVSPFEELRQMEYAQRLMLRRRAILHEETTPSVGRTLYARAAEGGARALRLRSGVIAAGTRADLVALACTGLLAAREGDSLLDTLIFAERSPVTDVFVAGQHVVTHGRHPLEEESAEAWQRIPL